MSHKKKFEELIKKENIVKRMQEAIDKIKAIYVSAEVTAYVENKIETTFSDEKKRSDIRSKIKGFMNAMSQSANIEMFKRQLAATIGEEKLKHVDEEIILKTIDEIEKDAAEKKNEFVDKYFNMVVEMSKAMEKPAGDVVENINSKENAAADKNKTDEPADIEMEMDIEKMRKELEKQKELTTDYLGSLQRMKADFDNYKKRIIREKEEYKTLAMESFFSELLAVLDCFDEIKPDSKIDYEGIQKIKKLLTTITEKYSLCEIDTKTLFDPNVHQALTTETRDDIEDNSIIETFRKGYKLGEKVIRPSLTKVSVKSEKPEGSESQSN